MLPAYSIVLKEIRVASFNILQQSNKHTLQRAIPTLIHPSRSFANSATIPRTQVASSHQQAPSSSLSSMRILAQVAIFPRAAQPNEDTSRQIIQQSAQEGIRTSPSTLPFAHHIQRAFGRHNLSHVQAHFGAQTTASARKLHARAYTMGNHIVFADRPDLHTVAHEAAHVIQQQRGVRLAGDIGEAGDIYEHHADAVAERVTSAQSAQGLLDHPGYPAMPQQKPLSAGTQRAIPSMSKNAAAPIQRRVVNVGREPLGVEFAKERGWITAKTVDLTLQWGGKAQAIEPVFTRVAQGKQVDETENIYLLGHGSAGHVGTKARSVQEIVQALNPIIPPGYKGGIFATSCWAGASETATGDTVTPGVEKLAAGLKQPNIPVIGARGKTYSHPELGSPEGSFRVVKPSASELTHQISSELDKQYNVSAAWQAAVVKSRKVIPEGELRQAGVIATKLSKEFYVNLITRLEKEDTLFPAGKDAFTIAVSKSQG